MDGLYWTDLHKQVPPLRLLPQIELQRIAKRLWTAFDVNRDPAWPVFGGARILWEDLGFRISGSVGDSGLLGGGRASGCPVQVTNLAPRGPAWRSNSRDYRADASKNSALECTAQGPLTSGWPQILFSF